MLEAMLLDPFGGIGKPEPLRGLPHTWSRRIDQRHRLVYRVFDDRIELVAARYYYDELVIRATSRLKAGVILGSVSAPVLGECCLRRHFLLTRDHG
jgi:hypothetical protein